MDTPFFEELARRARGAIQAELERGFVVDSKSIGEFDPVTEADRAAERAMRAVIEKNFPDHGIWGEEYGLERGEAAIRWSLDPVDGTRAFICGLPSWAILVGLVESGKHRAGMIDLPALNETLIAIDGECRSDGKIVHTSGCIRLSEARLTTTDPNLFDDQELASFERVRTRARLTRFGLDALGYARVATGGLDLVIESRLQPHDYDALVAVVRGAGGHLGNWRGGEDLSGGDIVAAASRSLYDEAVVLLSA